MKKKSIIGFLGLIAFVCLVTGCGNEAEKKNSNETRKKNPNETILTCTKVSGDYVDGSRKSYGYITHFKSIFVYEKKELKKATLYSSYNLSNFCSSISYKADLFDCYKNLQEQMPCSITDYDDNEDLKGTITNCTEQWDDYLYENVYDTDVQQLKDKDSFKTIEKAKDFHEKSLYKCEIE